MHPHLTSCGRESAFRHSRGRTGQQVQPTRGRRASPHLLSLPAARNSAPAGQERRSGLACRLLLCLIVVAGARAAWGGLGGVLPSSVGQLTVDDEGEGLEYPSALFNDPEARELFVVDLGKRRVVVYGSDHFPSSSIGRGRGVDAPRGGFLAANGRIYLCQGPTATSPSRISILNGAFIPEREIPLDGIPGTSDFVPNQMVVNHSGTMYVVGANSRGALVLDEDGEFLRWLQPLGPIPAWDVWPPADDEPQAALDGMAEQLPENSRFDIPEEFRPRGKEESAGGTGDRVGPVKVRAITIDSRDNLYLVSAQVGKVYVYDATETLQLSLGQKGGSPGTMSTPSGLAVDEAQGVIYVVDYMRHSVLAYDEKGTFQFEFGGRGTGPGWFNYPSDILVDNEGRLVVADRFNRRVQILKVERPNPVQQPPEG